MSVEVIAIGGYEEVGKNMTAVKIGEDVIILVIPKECDIVIAVAGLDVLGETIEAGCFRSRQVAAFLQKPLLHRIEEADLVQILLSERGTRKSVGKREYYVVLNKCDTQERMHSAQKIAVALQQAGVQHIAVTKLKDTDNEENNG